MKKKVVSGLLCAVMVASLTAGCGAKSTQTQETTKGGTTETTSKEAEAKKKNQVKREKSLTFTCGMTNSRQDMKTIMLQSCRQGIQ